MGHPAPRDHDLLYNWLYRNAGRTPLWRFPDVIKGDNLELRRLDFSNYQALPPLFAGDDNPFVEPRFRNLRDFYEYVGYLMAIFPYEPDHGGADYLVYDRCGWTLTGIVHAYDLSTEADVSDRAFVGFQFGPAFRGRGIAHRAVTALERYLLEGRGLRRLYGVTEVDNTHSQRFLLRRGYVHFADRGGNRTYLLTRGA